MKLILVMIIAMAMFSGAHAAITVSNGTANITSQTIDVFPGLSATYNLTFCTSSLEPVIWMSWLGSITTNISNDIFFNVSGCVSSTFVSSAPVGLEAKSYNNSLVIVSTDFKVFPVTIRVLESNLWNLSTRAISINVTNYANGRGILNFTNNGNAFI